MNNDQLPTSAEIDAAVATATPEQLAEAQAQAKVAADAVKQAQAQAKAPAKEKVAVAAVPTTDEQKGALQLQLRREVEMAKDRRSTHRDNASIMREDKFIQVLEFLLTTVRQLNLDRN